MQIKFVSVVLKKGFSPPQLPASISVYVTAVILSCSGWWLFLYMLHRTQQKDKIHYQALQYILFTKHQLLHLLKLNNGFRVTDTLSHLKAIHGSNSPREEVGLKWIKKRLRKYRTSDQQFNTCSAVSCIYWTVDAIIGSAVFVTTLGSTHALIPLWGWKNSKSHSTDLSIYEEEGGKKKLPGQISGTICGGEGGFEIQNPG